MKIWYDTEFIEDGLTIEPISIGMVREDGATLYRINDSEAVAARGCGLEWIYEEVMTKLPYTLVANVEYRTVVPLPNEAHPDFIAFGSIDQIAQEVEDFIASTPSPELWADYAAYDHILLAQLFGPMIELPSEIPMFTHEFRTLMRLKGVGDADLPVYTDPDGVSRRPHHALFDALELRHWFEHVSTLPYKRGRTQYVVFDI